MPGFAGFDVLGYPGDATMSWLKANTNLVPVGAMLFSGVVLRRVSIAAI